MRVGVIILSILFQILLINPANATKVPAQGTIANPAALDEYECISRVLFDENVMSVLLSMDASVCDANFTADTLEAAIRAKMRIALLLDDAEEANETVAVTQDTAETQQLLKSVQESNSDNKGEHTNKTESYKLTNNNGVLNLDINSTTVLTKDKADEPAPIIDFAKQGISKPGVRNQNASKRGREPAKYKTKTESVHSGNLKIKHAGGPAKTEAAEAQKESQAKEPEVPVEAKAEEKKPVEANKAIEVNVDTTTVVQKTADAPQPGLLNLAKKGVQVKNFKQDRTARYNTKKAEVKGASLKIAGDGKTAKADEVKPATADENTSKEEETEPVVEQVQELKLDALEPVFAKRAAPGASKGTIKRYGVRNVIKPAKFVLDEPKAEAPAAEMPSVEPAEAKGAEIGDMGRVEPQEEPLKVELQQISEPIVKKRESRPKTFYKTHMKSGKMTLAPAPEEPEPQINAENAQPEEIKPERVQHTIPKIIITPPQDEAENKDSDLPTEQSIRAEPTSEPQTEAETSKDTGTNAPIVVNVNTEQLVNKEEEAEPQTLELKKKGVGVRAGKTRQPAKYKTTQARGGVGEIKIKKPDTVAEDNDFKIVLENNGKEEEPLELIKPIDIELNIPKQPKKETRAKQQFKRVGVKKPVMVLGKSSSSDSEEKPMAREEEVPLIREKDEPKPQRDDVILKSDESESKPENKPDAAIRDVEPKPLVQDLPVVISKPDRVEKPAIEEDENEEQKKDLIRAVLKITAIDVTLPAKPEVVEESDPLGDVLPEQLIEPVEVDEQYEQIRLINQPLTNPKKEYKPSRFKKQGIKATIISMDGLLSPEPASVKGLTEPETVQKPNSIRPAPPVGRKPNQGLTFLDLTTPALDQPITEPAAPINKPEVKPESRPADNKEKESEGKKSSAVEPAKPNKGADVLIGVVGVSVAIPEASSMDTKPKGKYNGRTMIAIQSVPTRNLEEDKRSRDEIIAETLRLFNLLPPCVQAALKTCKPRMESVKADCERSYGNNKQCEVDGFSARLKCAGNETLINNACYRECPQGEFKTHGIFCLKGNFVERSISPYTGAAFDSSTHELYGNEHVVSKCSHFGKHFEPFGLYHCKQVCPPGFIDRGILCQRPARYQHQTVFTVAPRHVNGKSE